MKTVVNTAKVILAITIVLLGRPANAAEGVQRIQISAQPLATALMEFSKQTDIVVVAPAGLVEGKVAPQVSDELMPMDALQRLLKGSGLGYSRGREGEVTIVEGKSATNETDDLGIRLAQEKPSAAAERESVAANGRDATQQISEIIVTATKRPQSAQEVPLSIAVIGNQDIERRGLIGMEDYLRSIPGVNQMDTGGQGNAIVIRGIATSPQNENTSSGAGTTVSTYFDETPITGAGGMSAGGIDVRPVDIDRIEVLRGPQGTAFGSSSLGGTVRMIPMKPQLDAFRAKVAASYSNTSGFGSDNSMMQGAVNIPVVQDRFALRAVGYRYDESGIYENIAGIDPASIAVANTFGFSSALQGYTRGDSGRMVSTGGRLAALWKPTDTLDLSMNFLTQEIEQTGLPRANLTGYRQAIFPIVNAIAQRRGGMDSVADNHVNLGNLVLNYDLGWAGLTAVASRVSSGSDQVSAVPGTFPSAQPLISHFNSNTAELRLASHLQGPVQFLGGVYYEDLDENFLQHAHWEGPASTLPAGGEPLARIDITRNLKQKAVFGEVSYDLTDKLTATAGGRYFEYDKHARELREGVRFFGIPVGAGVPVLLDNDEDGTSLKANLSFKPAEDALLYLSWTEGFRLGKPAAGLAPGVCDVKNTAGAAVSGGDGLIDGTNVSIASTRLVNSDFLENYELGGKFTFMDRRLVIDADVFHIVWQGLPIRVLAPTAPVGCGLPYVGNVGAATSEGVEVQASLLLVKGLRIDLGGAYNDAQLSQDAPGLTVPAFKGDRLPGSPRVSANLAVQYDFNLAGYDTFVRADSFYTGEFFGDLNSTALTAAGDYVKIDARAGVEVRNLSVEFYVRNLTNADEFTFRGLSNADGNFGWRLRPRTVGLQLGYSFE